MSGNTDRFRGTRIAKAATASFGHQTPIITLVIPTPVTEALGDLQRLGVGSNEARWETPRINLDPENPQLLRFSDKADLAASATAAASGGVALGICYGRHWYTLFLTVAEVIQRFSQSSILAVVQDVIETQHN
jgi:hypothetical protein